MSRKRRRKNRTSISKFRNNSDLLKLHDNSFTNFTLGDKILHNIFLIIVLKFEISYETNKINSLFLARTFPGPFIFVSKCFSRFPRM